MVTMFNKYLVNETEMGPGFSRPLTTFLRLPEVHTKVNSVCTVRLWAHSLQVETLPGVVHWRALWVSSYLGLRVWPSPDPIPINLKATYFCLTQFPHL